MLGAFSPWFSRRRAPSAGSVCITAVALWAAVACGSDGDSPGPTQGDGGSGGTGPSSGGTDSTGGAGGAPTDGGGGETSTDGGGGSGGGSSAAGDFSSVWQAESVELLFFDAADPAGLVSHSLEMPAKTEAPDDGR